MRLAGRILSILGIAMFVPLVAMAVGLLSPDQVLGPAVYPVALLGAPVALLTWALAVYQCVFRFPGSRDQRLAWILVLVFCAVFGAWAYWFFGPGTQSEDAQSAS